MQFVLRNGPKEEEPIFIGLGFSLIILGQSSPLVLEV